MLIFLRGQPVLQGLDPETRSLVKLRLSVQGLHQHLADPPLPRRTTLGGLAQPLGHLRPVPSGLSIRYHLLRTLKPLRLTLLRCCQTCFKLPLVNLPPSSGGQGDSAPGQTVASEPTVGVASIYDDAPQSPEDQSEGEIIESKGDPADAGLPILDNLKMYEEEQQDFDDFSLASVSVPASKQPWRAQGDSKDSSLRPRMFLILPRLALRP